MSFAKTSAVLKIPVDTLCTTIDRIANILHDGLVVPWSLNPPRPVLSSMIVNAGLLVDATYVPVPRVLDDFEAGKVLWDEHHKVYAVKKQICIQAGFPFLAVHSAPKEVGSKADVKILKKNANSIEPLTETPNGRCSVIGDKGYITGDPLPFRLVTPKRTNMAGYNPAENILIAQARVHVEQFFGRMKCTWKVLAGKYRRALVHLDRDFDILVVLTNRLISARPLPTVSEQTIWTRIHEQLRQRYITEHLRKRARISVAAATRRIAMVEERVPVEDGSWLDMVDTDDEDEAEGEQQ